MELTITVDRPSEGPKSGSLQVGWFLTKEEGAVLFDPPERVSVRQVNKSHAKSAGRCPAIVQLESRYFMVKSPYDLHLGFGRNEKGAACLINRLGASSPVRANKLSNLVTLVPEREWRFADRPTIQLGLPYCFISDELVYVSQIAPFMHYLPNPWPGTIFGGRFPTSVWPRPLMWALEWIDTSKDVIIKRGDPLFYCHFEGEDPSRSIQLVEAERTPELLSYTEKLSGVVSYVNQTFSLFKAAEAIRPEKLLSPKK